jgi:hypothetical protein
VIIVDTGPLVAAALYRDPDYRRCVDLFAGLHLAKREMVIPAPVIAEVGYLLGTRAGAEAEAFFLRSLAEGVFQVEDLTTADHERVADLVEQYGDLPLGTTDAAVITVAERLDVPEVATLDDRHFTVVRPKHASPDAAAVKISLLTRSQLGNQADHPAAGRSVGLSW